MRRARLLFDILKRTESTSRRLLKATSLDGTQVRLMRVPESSFGRDAPHIERLAQVGEIRTSQWRSSSVTVRDVCIKALFLLETFDSCFARPDLNGTQELFTVTTKPKTLKRGLSLSRSNDAQATARNANVRPLPHYEGLAETIIAPKHHGEDLLGTIMSDSDDSRQPLFLSMLPQVIPAEAHRQILLDGLAREYAGADNWMAYVESETSK